eukprot:576370-Alexandrium_andersonii.AAC.1
MQGCQKLLSGHLLVNAGRGSLLGLALAARSLFILNFIFALVRLLHRSRNPLADTGPGVRINVLA